MPGESASSRTVNHLSRATSPYLLQHAHNPVDWHEWGPEALDLARRENKPIFLSIGYSACHWCHVMAHESFENETIAAVMNRWFVNVKVDREERPDLDGVYMQATMLLNHGQGGWPMSVWLTPDLRPFFAGTYFPPESRWGRPGFGELCERIGMLWREQQPAIESDAARLADAIHESLKPASRPASIDLPMIDRAVDVLAQAFDPADGGLISGGTNKFPPTMALELLLRSAVRRSPLDQPDARSRKLLDTVALTLDRMSRGGITDHLGGGICRYSTDPQWLVPHFEKMLYDQALVSRSYVDAWLATGSPRMADAARHIYEYVLADLASPGGGFRSARDADSEGEEGKFYVWTRRDVTSVLGDEDGALACAYFGVTDAGNWDDPHAPGVPKNVLHTPRDIETVARELGVSPSDAQQRIESARQRLLAARSLRTPPGLDDKILCEWNGLMIASLARGGAVLDETRYVDAARRGAAFVLDSLTVDGRLCRSWRDGRVSGRGFLTDYAALIEACLELYEATFDRAYIDRAKELTATAIALFWDEAGGAFFLASADHDVLFTRAKDTSDGATPAGNSVMLMNLLRLSAITGDAAPRERAERMIAALSADAMASIGSSERFLQGVEFALAGPVEIAIVGALSDPRTQALLREVRRAYLPNRVLMHTDPHAPGDAVDSPLLTGRTLVGDAPAAYVCRGYACDRPTTEAGELRKLLAAARLRDDRRSGGAP